MALLDDANVPIEPNLEEYVKTIQFDQHCARKALELAALSSDKSGGSDEELFWSNDDSTSSATTVHSAPYEITKYEANLYYAGVGPKGRGPKLIYRTSKDKFVHPSGAETYKRLMRAIPVPDSHEFGQNGMWDQVRDRVVELLDRRNIKVSSVDFVRFTWLDKRADEEIEEEADDDDDDDATEEEDLTYDEIPPIKPVKDGDRYYTNPTIWIGVEPDSLTGAEAHESSQDILAHLNSLKVQNIDIAYRESLNKPLLGHGPALFKPSAEGDPLSDVIDDVSVALSLPISGRKTPMQGTLGPYFRDGKNLYAITVRHNLFLRQGDNGQYSYHESEPKREVLVMGNTAFAKYLASIQAFIGTYLDSAVSIERKVNTYQKNIENGIQVQESQTMLERKKDELVQMRTKIDDLKAFYVQIKQRWSKTNERVIGFVRWAPPIGVGVPPHRYTRDLCVIQLYKNKFQNMLGNVLSLGPELSPSKLKALMYERADVQSHFKYPEDGLLPLKGMLTATTVNNPNTLKLQGAHIRHVLKRGFTTNTTVGTLTGFKSFVRHHDIPGPNESLEIAIFNHENDTGTFSRGGDSGSLIVSASGEFVGLLTGGTDKGTDSSDITYATLFEWVWELVKKEFPGASLHFDNLNLSQFFADVA